MSVGKSDYFAICLRCSCWIRSYTDIQLYTYKRGLFYILQVFSFAVCSSQSYTISIYFSVASFTTRFNFGCTFTRCNIFLLREAKGFFGCNAIWNSFSFLTQFCCPTLKNPNFEAKKNYRCYLIHRFCEKRGVLDFWTFYMYFACEKNKTIINSYNQSIIASMWYWGVFFFFFFMFWCATCLFVYCNVNILFFSFFFWSLYALLSFFTKL